MTEKLPEPTTTPEDWRKTPGIYSDLSEVDYHAETRVASKSQLDKVNRSVAHWRHAMTTPHDPTPAMIKGSVFHCMVLEPERFKDRYIVMPQGMERRSKIGKAKYAEWQKSIKPGQQLIAQELVDDCKAMSESVFAHKEATWLLKDAIREASFVWPDDEKFRQVINDQVGGDSWATPVGSGQMCKARVDAWKREESIFTDLKSTGNGSPIDFARALYNFRYHVQGAFYTDGARWHGIEAKVFALIVTESTAPFVTTVYCIQPAAMDHARLLYCHNLDSLGAAKETGQYPGYSTGMLDIDLPAWAYNA